MYLFTASDLKTIVIPSTVFGMISTLSGQIFPSNVPFEWLSCTWKAARILFWVWINLLPFNISNQRSDAAIQEDSVNKPWRPLPSKRIDSQRAFLYQILGYLLTISSSWIIGGAAPSLSLYMLGYSYNELHGADVSWLRRNLINMAGYMSFLWGASEVFAGTTLLRCELRGQVWFLIIGAIVFTSVQAQDIADQEGDARRFRKTLPLTIGDRPARYTILISLLTWSVAAPAYWSLPLYAYVLTICIGTGVGVRFVLKTSIEADKHSFQLWNI